MALRDLLTNSATLALNYLDVDTRRLDIKAVLEGKAIKAKRSVKEINLP